MMNMENFKKTIPNFKEVKDKIIEKIDENIHNLEQKKENELSLGGDFPGIYTPNIEEIETAIQKKKDLKENLENKDYFSQN